MIASCNTPTCSILSNTFAIGLLPLLLTPLVGYFYALWFHASKHEFDQLALDALLPPVGMIHGIILLFG